MKYLFVFGGGGGGGGRNSGVCLRSPITLLLFVMKPFETHRMGVALIYQHLGGCGHTHTHIEL